MKFMNEWDIHEAMQRYDSMEFTNLAEGARILDNLVTWTNNHSDGWAYWPKPIRAAQKLQELLDGSWSVWEDCSKEDIKKALVPIKSFLTRQGEDWQTVLGMA